MVFQFNHEETIPAGVRRITAEQLDNAAGHLETVGDQRDKHVHEARKSMKRLRAVVRLVRFELGEEAFQRENACFRDAGIRLSELRDAAVLVESLDRVVERCGQKVPRSRFARVRQWLVERREAAYQQSEGGQEAERGVVEELRQARLRLEEWPLRQQDWEAIEPGVRRVYARGYCCFASVYRQPSDEGFHEWRKWAKYMWYHTDLLQQVWPAVMVPVAGELDQLGELLGQDHDLAVLRSLVLSGFPRTGATATVQALIRRIREQRAQLQSMAHGLGLRLYAERPGAFAPRLGGYWRAWKG